MERYKLVAFLDRGGLQRVARPYIAQRHTTQGCAIRWPYGCEPCDENVPEGCKGYATGLAIKNRLGLEVVS